VEFAAALDDGDAPQYAVPTRASGVGHIMVPITLNQQGPFRFMLDTGATATVITSATARQLQLNNGERSVIVHGLSGSGVFPTVSLQQFAAGSLEFQNRSMPVLQGGVMPGIDGILGSDGLTDKKITVNFTNNSVRIADSSGLPTRPDRFVVPFAFAAKRLPLISVQVGRMRIKAVIDTGAMYTLGNRALAAALDAQGIQAVRRRRVVDATETAQMGAVALLPSMRLGSIEVMRLPVTFAGFRIFDYWGLSDQPALLIGMDVLGSFDELAIDYGRQQLHLRPPM
jgi:predicted aspartyl protease